MKADLRNARRVVGAGLPKANAPLPHSDEAERGVLGCVFLAPDCMTEIRKLPQGAFYDLRNATIYRELRAMWEARAVIDGMTFHLWLKDKRLLKECGGLEYVQTLPDAAPSVANLSYYLGIVRQKYALRQLAHVCTNAVGNIVAKENDPESVMMAVRAELDIASRIGLNGAARRPALKIWSAEDLQALVPDPALQLVGDSEIMLGNMTVLAGPGSAGKSLCSTSLALGLAIGSGTWMGRRIHRQGRTLILQAENGTTRLKKEVEALRRNHPDVPFNDLVFFSEPPDGGLPFHRPEFRAEVHEQCERIKPDLVIVDPWSQVATEDASKEVIDKVNEIRACVRYGDTAPALLVIAHTKKPRPEDVRKGRGLVYLVSGSIALPNASRCTYVLLPWTDDPEDDRIYWCTPKLNDGENYGATVWKRRFGTFFQHDDKTDPRTWGRDDDEDCRHAVTESQLLDAFGKDVEVHKRELVKRLVKATACGEPTAYRALDEDGYLRHLISRSGTGKWKLKDPQ